MGDLVDVKRRKIYSLLRWLETKPLMSVDDGGKHQYLVRCEKWQQPFPIPFKHNVVKSVFVKRLMKQLIESGVCTEDEFRSHL